MAGHLRVAANPTGSVASACVDDLLGLEGYVAVASRDLVCGQQVPALPGYAAGQARWPHDPDVEYAVELIAGDDPVAWDQIDAGRSAVADHS